MVENLVTAVPTMGQLFATPQFNSPDPISSTGAVYQHHPYHIWAIVPWNTHLVLNDSKYPGEGELTKIEEGHKSTSPISMKKGLFELDTGVSLGNPLNKKCFSFRLTTWVLNTAPIERLKLKLRTQWSLFQIWSHLLMMRISLAHLPVLIF